jgi:aspartate carbamoyltransferase catalytic subunit
MNSQQDIIYGLMGDLEEALDKGFSPFGYYSVVKKDTVTDLLDRLYAALPDEIKEARALLRRKDELQYEAQQKAEKIIADADILYMTRVQKERFSDLMEYERVKNTYRLTNETLKNAKPNLKVMHPLPRVNEIAYEVDENPHAYYIQQAKNGLYAREAIFSYCLGITLDDVKNDKTIITSKF